MKIIDKKNKAIFKRLKKQFPQDSDGLLFLRLLFEVESNSPQPDTSLISKLTKQIEEMQVSQQDRLYKLGELVNREDILQLVKFFAAMVTNVVFPDNPDAVKDAYALKHGKANLGIQYRGKQLDKPKAVRDEIEKLVANRLGECGQDNSPKMVDYVLTDVLFRSESETAVNGNVTPEAWDELSEEVGKLVITFPFRVTRKNDE